MQCPKQQGRDKGYLQEHVASSHLGIVMYSCPCPKDFMHRTAFRTHMSSVHKMNIRGTVSGDNYHIKSLSKEEIVEINKFIKESIEK